MLLANPDNINVICMASARKLVDRYINDAPVSVLTPMDISRAPDTPGLYAWYAIPDIGRTDWEHDVVDGKDLGIGRFRKLLERHTLKFAPPPLAATATGSFSRKYEGQLVNTEYGSVQTTINNEDASASSALEQTIESPELRQVAVNILMDSATLFHSPLYIGVATSLNSRLSKHVNDLIRFSEAVRGDPEKRDRLLNVKTSSFASRATGMGFTIDNMYVVILDTSVYFEKSDNKDKVKTLSESVEWLLNRWSNPILGRK